MAICSVYAPNDDSPMFFEALDQNLMDLHWNRLIIGDFNLVLDTTLDRYNSNANNLKAAKRLKEMMNEYALSDTWRLRNIHERFYSWRNHTGARASRIDFFLLTKSAEQLCEHCTYTQGVKSDHSAIFLTLKDNVHERGAGYWKANTSLLENEDILKKIKMKTQRDIQATATKDPLEQWKYVKSKIIKNLKQAARENVSEKQLIKAQLAEKISSYEECFPLPEKDYKLYIETKEEFNQILDEKAQQIIFRSKVRWHENGEKPSRYFLNLEKVRGAAKTCQMLLREDGTKVETLSEIMDEQCKFYRTLYKSDPTVIFEINNPSHEEFLKDQDIVQLDADLSLRELKTAIMGMSKNKAPGPDGLPIEVYQKLWDELSDVLLKTYKYVFEKGEMHPDAMNGVLNLIPKQGKDTRFLKNLRPITLLNSDYKIIERVIANRIQEVLPGIIHHDQAGFMKNRQAALVVRKMMDLMQLCQNNEEQGIMLCLDFVKAFDKVEEKSIQGSLHYFGFPRFIKEWVRILYTGFTVQIQNNGFLSEKIQIQRSVHQGGCCSAFLFIILVEIMASKIREDQNIQGLKDGESEHKLNQFADDTSIASTFSQTSLDAAFQKLEWFKTQSGLELSYEKTSIYRIGSLRNSDMKLITQQQISWVTEGVQVLGIFITHKDNILEKNYSPIITRAENTIKSWRSRTLSLSGKITVINSLISSMFVHKMMVLPQMSEEIIRKIESLFSDFIWSGAKPKIPLRTLKLAKKHAGLGLVDLRTKEIALKCSWIRLLKHDEKCASLAYQVFSPALKEDVFKASIDPEEVGYIVKRDTSPFWYDVLVAWNIFRKTQVDSNSPEGEMIWWNSSIRINGEPFFWETPYKRGLIWVSQLYINSRRITTKEAEDSFGLNYLDFYSIVTAIPEKWRNYLQENLCENKTVVQELVQIRNIPRHVYSKLQIPPSFEGRRNTWEKELDCVLSEKDWLKQFKRIYVTTNVEKLRSFQYRLLHRALILNSHLYRWNKRGDNKCTFCDTEKETLIHLFSECAEIADMWKRIGVFIEEITGDLCQISPKNIILNEIGGDMNSVANLICLIVKQYIYAQRCLRKPIDYHQILCLVFRYRDIEKYIAVKNGNINKHNVKWQCIKSSQEMYPDEYEEKEKSG